MDRSWELTSLREIPAGVPGASRLGETWKIGWSGCGIMGIVNVTPDSFSDGGLHVRVDDAVSHGLLLARQGALIIDVGGESTRPGAVDVDVDVELRRVLPVIERLAAAGVCLISIDTRKPAVAAAAVEAGAHIVNDVGGLRDAAMVDTCATLGVPAVVVHMQGSPATMQTDPHYDDVVPEVRDWLESQAEQVLAVGVPGVILDPGIGFGKTFDHNVALLRALPTSSRFPVLIGASRKRLVLQLSGQEYPNHRDPGSVAVHLWAAQRGVALVRVHDVAAHSEAFAVDGGLRPPGTWQPH